MKSQVNFSKFIEKNNVSFIPQADKIIIDPKSNSQQRRRCLRQTSRSFFFLKGHLPLIFVVLQIKIIHIYLQCKYVSYDRSHLLQPCGKLFLWAPPVPFRNFYPFAPPPPPPRILISSRVTRIYVIISDWWVSLTRVTIGPILMCV